MEHSQYLLIALSAVAFYFAQGIRDLSDNPRAPNLNAGLIELAGFVLGSFGLVLAGKTEEGNVLVIWGYCAIVFILMMGLCVRVSRLFPKRKI